MQQMHDYPVTLVLGGVRSGKSRYAQQLAAHWERVAFIATATAGDDEMSRKIARHREDRPAHWQTIEEPLHISEQLSALDLTADCILIDCLTLFSANLLEAANDNDEEIGQHIDSLCNALHAVRCPIILVSNEVGSGVVPASVSGRRYRDLLGELNQRVATVADDVILMVAGLPLALKGHLEVSL